MPAADRSGYGPGWRKVRLVVLARDGHVCRWCGARATQADHLVPLAEGGDRLDLANLVASCGPCNARRGAQLVNGRRHTTRLRPSRRW